MDIRVLQYFLAVAREESITRAAEALHMTQPPLSRQLRELEEELGTRLFIRGSRRIRLTEDGMLLRKRAEELIELMDKTRAELKNSDEHISGDIRIGAGETAAISLFAQVAASVRQKYPLIRYFITSGDSEIVLERLDKGLIDFALFVGEVDIDKYEALTLPVRDSWGILMRRDSPLACKARITNADLRDQPLCMSRQTAVTGELWHWLGADADELNITVEYNLLYNATHFVRHGLGYAFALDKLINTGGDSDLCFRPLDPPLEAQLHLTWKRDQLFSRSCATFLEAFRSEWCANE